VDRLRHAAQLDAIIGAWFADLTADEACAILEEHEVAAARMRTIDDLFTDPQVAENGMIVSVEDPELGEVRMQGVTPKLSRTPGAVRSAGPAMGAGNAEIYARLLGLSADDISLLKEKQVI
jgi:crotonobetainyl-CoA:carnitine CoA-transferase CaiB-like acyl-CoA transferase